MKRFDKKTSSNAAVSIFYLMIFQMSEDELEAFVKLVDDNGEISKNDIIIQVKNIYICGTG